MALQKCLCVCFSLSRIQHRLNVVRPTRNTKICRVRGIAGVHLLDKYIFQFLQSSASGLHRTGGMGRCEHWRLSRPIHTCCTSVIDDCSLTAVCPQPLVFLPQPRRPPQRQLYQWSLLPSLPGVPICRSRKAQTRSIKELAMPAHQSPLTNVRINSFLHYRMLQPWLK